MNARLCQCLAGFSSHSGFVVSPCLSKVLGCLHNCRYRRESPWVDGFGEGDLSGQRRQPHATPKFTSSAPSCRLDSASGLRPEHQNLIHSFLLFLPLELGWAWGKVGIPVSSGHPWTFLCWSSLYAVSFLSCGFSLSREGCPPWAGTLCPTPHSPDLASGCRPASEAHGHPERAALTPLTGPDTHP